MFPNSDPVMFMVAFYGCLLAELVPVPIEVPLTRKVQKWIRPRPQCPAGLCGCRVTRFLLTLGCWLKQVLGRGKALTGLPGL